MPELTWRKDETVIKSKYISYENFTATYIITEAREEHCGNYSCSAKNSAGSAQTSASVLVQEAPTFDYAHEHQLQRLMVGTKWQVPIRVLGLPTPQISWMCNDRSIKDFKRVVVHTEQSEGLTNISIQSLKLEDAGVFTLTASNSAGKASISFNLRVDEETEVTVKEKQERPAAPGGPLDITDIT